MKERAAPERGPATSRADAVAVRAGAQGAVRGVDQLARDPPRARSASWARRIAGLALATAVVLAAPVATARDARPSTGAAEVAIAELPPEARDTLALIKRGGPFPYRRDGTVFQNRERRLPIRPRGHYREYTVRTPGSRDRGARRIVAGKGDTGDPATSGEYWYTADHYRSFRRIRTEEAPR